MAQAQRTNRIQQISVDFNRKEIQCFRNDSTVRWYPVTDKRLNTLRCFEDNSRYRFNERAYGWFVSMWVRPRY